MKDTLTLGIDIGGTNTVYGFIKGNGNILLHEEIPTNGDKPISDLIERIGKSVEVFLSKNSQYSLVGIGIGAPNGNHYTGKIQSPPNLSWGDINIVRLFKDRFNCVVKLTNDANAAALGEKSFGLAKDMKDFIVVTLGTGLGSGIYSSGKLIYGYDGFAGEMGHISIDFDGRLCKCGNKGCLETYVSATGIKTTIEELYNKKYPGDVLLKKLIENNYDGSCLDKAYDKGNEVAIEIYTYTGQKLGQGLSLVANLLSPEAFIFYGGVSKAGERILSPAKDVMKENLINGKDCDIRLIQSALPSGQAGILGASSLIWLE